MRRREVENLTQSPRYTEAPLEGMATGIVGVGEVPVSVVAHHDLLTTTRFTQVRGKIPTLTRPMSIDGVIERRGQMGSLPMATLLHY